MADSPMDSCCVETGASFKMSQVLGSTNVGHVERMVGTTLIGHCLETIASEITKSCGIDTTVVGRLFSEMSAIGLRMPYHREV